MSEGLELARAYHRNLPERLRLYLQRERGIADSVMDWHLLGWNGSRITIPIFDRAGNFVFFKLAKDPEDTTDSPEMLAMSGARAELYGLERVLAKPGQITICEGEFDRLVLESQGFAAVTSTGGALTFRPEWAEALGEISNVFVCFDNDAAGQEGAERVARLIPDARLVRLPEEVGEGGDVTDFFVRLGKSREDFVELLKSAQPLPEQERTVPPSTETHRVVPAVDEEVDRLKSLVAVEDIVGRYLTLRPSGQNFAARCPFHEDQNPSFVVYPRTRSFYRYGCREHGDVLSFLMRKEHLTFSEALNALRELSQ